MRRVDIRNYTIVIITICIILFVLICIFTPKYNNSNDNQNRLAGTTIWSDTISSTPSSTAALQAMQRDAERFMSKWELKGMQISVMRNDSLLYTRGFGYADKEENQPMKANSIMRIASSSKLLTAAAIMKLVEDGKLKLTDTVFGPRGILNDRRYTEAVRDKRHFNITVADLLRHSGGFTLGAGDPMFNTKDIMKVKKLRRAPTNPELISIVLERRLGFTPGVGHRYSNFGYMLLSQIIERKSGQNYWDFVQHNLLTPAGISGLRPATNYYSERYPNEVRYYPPDGEKIEEFNGSGRMVDRCYGGTNINGLMGAGGWLASSADLARFVASIDGNPRIHDVLSQNSIHQMTKPYTKDDKEGSFGWTKVEKEGHWVRSGTLASAHSLIERFPDGECWVITMNTGVWRGFHFTRELQRLITTMRQRYSAELPRQDLF